MNSKLNNRSFSPIQEMPWHSEETSERREALNQEIGKLSSERDKIVCDAKDVRESCELVKLSDVDKFRKRIFDFLKTEIEIRSKVIEFYQNEIREDAKAYADHLNSVINSADDDLAERFESIGFRPFDKSKPSPGSWFPEMIQRHPLIVDNRAELPAIREFMVGSSSSQAREEELLSDAQAERRSMAEVNLPV